MLYYPKIPGSKCAPLARCVAFEKLDGTNLHWAWQRELGWYAVGTRRERFDLDDAGIAAFSEQHVHLRASIAVFRATLAAQLAEVFAQPRYQASDEIVVFTEFLGDHSFAGLHQPDDPKRLCLIDVRTDGGFVDPETFVTDFGHLPSAQVVYRGKLTGKFAQDVRDGKYNVGEGVICKGVAAGAVWMVKIKTNAYLARLKQAFADQWEKYWE